MRNIILKDFIRDIFQSKGRFLSILIIVALGVAFFSGIKISPSVMKETTNKYYKDYNLMDIRLVSTLGLTDKDADEVKKIPEVESVFPTYTLDTLSKYKDRKDVFRVHGFKNGTSGDKNYINRLKLVKGRLPKKSGECVVVNFSVSSLNIPLNTKLKLESGKSENLDKSLKTTEYTVVGQIQNPYYITNERDNVDIGNGSVSSILYVPQNDFKLDSYTDMFVTIKNAKNMDYYSTDYAKKVKIVKDRIKKLSDIRIRARYDEVKNDAQDKLNNGRDTLNKEKDKANKKLNDSKEKLDNGRSKIENGEIQLKDKEKQVDHEFSEADKKIKDGKEQLSTARKKYNRVKSEFTKNQSSVKKQIDEAKGKINGLKNAVDNLNFKISQLEVKLENKNTSEIEKQQIQIQLNELKSNYNKLNATYQGARAELNKNIEKYESAKRKLDLTEKKLDDSDKELMSQSQKLDLAKQKSIVAFEKAHRDVQKQKKKLNDSYNEFTRSKQSVLDKFKDEDERIADSQREVDKIKRPEWYVLDRKSSKSLKQFSEAIDNISSMATVFPVFFFAVAALVSLTTMARMVDEQRMYIGTLKALGYKGGKIAQKYIFYALSASLMGSIIGVAIGYTVFPHVIYNAYRVMFEVPDPILVFKFSIAIGVTVTFVGLISLISYIACRRELLEMPSVLMVHKAPRQGKKILLEKIPFIWNKMNFTGKVTMRNMFRYKKRFLMTILGIIGCTALILTAFGIKDSIKKVAIQQFEEIYNYNLTVSLDKNYVKNNYIKLNKSLSKEKEIKNYELIDSINSNAYKNSKSSKITMYVPKNNGELNRFINLFEKDTGDNINLGKNGVVITQNISNRLGIKKGDKIKLKVYGKEKSVLVDDVVEQYVSDYVYISQEYYHKIFGKNIEYNMALINLKDNTQKKADGISRRLLNIDGINGLSNNDDVINNIGDIIGNMNYVVSIMTISAGALAFIVLYNLTNVNISERIREIATIKVLGFYDREVSSYVFRENLILTIIGIVIGLIVGKFLHEYIMTTVQSDDIMYGKNIGISSYLLAAFITIILSLIVNISMYHKLKKVKMVESLKSVD